MATKGRLGSGGGQERRIRAGTRILEPEFRSDSGAQGGKSILDKPTRGGEKKNRVFKGKRRRAHKKITGNQMSPQRKTVRKLTLTPSRGVTVKGPRQTCSE